MHLVLFFFLYVIYLAPDLNFSFFNTEESLETPVFFHLQFLSLLLEQNHSVKEPQNDL